MLRTKHWLSMQYYLRYKSSCTQRWQFFLPLSFVHKMEEFANANIVACNRLSYHTHTFPWNPWKLLSYFECLHRMFLDAWNSTVHRFKSTKKINNNIKSIQEGFQKFYMEGEKSERSYTWNMIYVTSQIVYIIQV